jgi:predicted aldo/keto reductase-like oxidoreductase
LLKAKREGLTRFVGISGHCRPGRFVRILNEFDIDVMMNAVNFVDRHTYNFEQQVWPIAKHQNVGLVAMKVFGGPEGKAMSSKMPVQYIPQAVRYALSLPGAAAAVLGMSSREELHQNVGLARDYKPLTAEEQAGLDKIGTEMAKEWGARFGPIA